MGEGYEIKPFLPVGEYDWPVLPAEDRLRLAMARLKAELFRSGDPNKPAIETARLESIATDRLDQIVAPPTYGTLLDEMALTLQPWRKGSSSAPRVQLIVMPPCENANLVEEWSEQQGLQCLDAPIRDDLISSSPPNLPDLAGDSVLVIPNLERWILRHHNGLRSVRMLLAHISSSERRFLIGCNSWAWTYLVSVLDADLQFPDAMTFQAFDRHRLHHWFADLARNPASGVSAFLTSDSGKDVFAVDENGALQSDFFQKLSAHSLGIPWVAWHLWRRSLREKRETEDEKNTPKSADDDDNAIWIATPPEFSLPLHHRQQALLVLQSLLIHGPLHAAHLALTVPDIIQTNMVEALVRAGFIDREHGILSCNCAAYPAVRRELANAGYSMDRL